MNYNRSIKYLTAIMLLLGTLFYAVPGYCQEKQPPGQKPQVKPQSLTAGQIQQIKKILSGYKASTLTADQAKVIHEKFREAGIRGGAETNAAITAAGFDPEKLRELAPPPDQAQKEKSGPPSPDERMRQVEEKICKPLSLSAAPLEEVKKAFSVFYTEMDKLVKSEDDRQAPPDKSKVEPLEKARDEKIKQVLSDEQFKKYLELEKASRPGRAEGKEQKR